MASKRSTIDVAKVLKWANTQLRFDDNTKEFKMGICSLVEQVLHDTGNYNGFGFHSNAHSETGSFGYYTRYYYPSDKIRANYKRLTSFPE
jgi:hypothetical protein